MKMELQLQLVNIPAATENGVNEIAKIFSDYDEGRRDHLTASNYRHQQIAAARMEQERDQRDFEDYWQQRIVIARENRNAPKTRRRRTHNAPTDQEVAAYEQEIAALADSINPDEDSINPDII